MSQLTQLKQQLESIAQQSKSTGAGLAAFKSKFSQSISQVQSSIGGSAQRKDQEIMQSLQNAQKQVEAAAQALDAAARTAQAYGQSL